MDPTLADIVRAHSKFNCTDILKLAFQNMVLAEKDGKNLFEVYMYVTPGGNTRIIQQTRLYLSLRMIQNLITRINDFEYYKLEMSVFHPLTTVEDGYDVKFKQLKDFEQLSYKPEPDFYFSFYSPSVFADNSPRFRKGLCNPDMFAESCLRLTPCRVYLKADGKTMQTIAKSADNTTLDNLKPEVAQALSDLINIVGQERILNLAKILDPNWKYKSSKLHLAIELQEQIIIKGYGNSGFTQKGKMYQYLHEKHPKINPLPYPQEDEKKFNNETRRLATLAKPDKTD